MLVRTWVGEDLRLCERVGLNYAPLYPFVYMLSGDCTVASYYELLLSLVHNNRLTKLPPQLNYTL